MIPDYMSPVDFIHLAERVESENAIGFDTGSNFIIFGFASMWDN